MKERKVFGDWEGDLMIFRRELGKANVASLVERKTRFAVLFRNNDRSTKHLMDRLMNVMEPLPQPARRSITFDRGIEFSGWRQLHREIGTQAWFCDPQAPSRQIASCCKHAFGVTQSPAGQCVAKGIS